MDIKGSSDPSHFIFEINVGKGRIRHTTTLNLHKVIFNRFGVDLEIQFQSRCMSDPTLSDIDFRNKMAWVWTTLNLNEIFHRKSHLTGNTAGLWSREMSNFWNHRKWVIMTFSNRKWLILIFLCHLVSELFSEVSGTIKSTINESYFLGENLQVTFD